jgi:integrase
MKNAELGIRKAAGLPENFRLHGLRHNFASQLVSSGKSLSVVQKLMTHKDQKTTQRYAHLAPDVVRDAVDKSPDMLIPKKAEIIELSEYEGNKHRKKSI